MTVIIPVNQSQACSSVSLTDDEIAEGPQTFSVSIYNVSPTGDFNSSESVVIEIQDNDGKHKGILNKASSLILCDTLSTAMHGEVVMTEGGYGLMLLIAKVAPTGPCNNYPLYFSLWPAYHMHFPLA